jgi:hypothetical protein
MKVWHNDTFYIMHACEHRRRIMMNGAVWVTRLGLTKMFFYILRKVKNLTFQARYISGNLTQVSQIVDLQFKS